MPHAASLASLSPAIVLHLIFAAAALTLGPVALLARKGSRRIARSATAGSR